MSKTLVLMNARWPQSRFFIDNYSNQNADLQPIYKIRKKNFLYSISALHMEYLKAPLQHIWYFNWKNRISNYSTIIVFGCILSLEVLKYIYTKNPNARIIYYHWDTIGGKERILPTEYSIFCEEWSFDPDDCQQYGFRNNRQFYIPKPITPNAHEGRLIKYDFIMVLRDKNRYHTVKSLVERLKNLGYSLFVRIQPDKYTKDASLPYYGSEISYDKLVDLTLESKCIIELNKDGQNGLSLRALESIFYEKKLITNNKAIVNEPFYHPDNILVIDGDNMDKFESEVINFMSAPYIQLAAEIREMYSFESWLNNFGI